MVALEERSGGHQNSKMLDVLMCSDLNGGEIPPERSLKTKNVLIFNLRKTFYFSWFSSQQHSNQHGLDFLSGSLKNCIA